MSQSNGCIYCIERKDNGKKYIGQTTNLNKRIRNYLRYSWGSKIARIIRNQGIDKFNIYKLEKNIPKKDLNERERYWIKKHNTCKGYGYNENPGGGVSRGPKVNKGYVKKITRLYRKGKTYKEISEKMPFSKSTVGSICRGDHPKCEEIEWKDYISN